MKSYSPAGGVTFLSMKKKIESQGTVSMDSLCFDNRSLQKPRFIPVL